MPRIIDPAKDEFNAISGQLDRLTRESNARATISSQQLSGAHPLAPTAGQGLAAARQGNYGAIYGPGGIGWENLSPNEQRQIQAERPGQLMRRRMQPMPGQMPGIARHAVPANEVRHPSESPEQFVDRRQGEGAPAHMIRHGLGAGSDRGFARFGQPRVMHGGEGGQPLTPEQREARRAEIRQRVQQRQAQRPGAQPDTPLEAPRDGMLPHGARRREADLAAKQNAEGSQAVLRTYAAARNIKPEVMAGLEEVATQGLMSPQNYRVFVDQVVGGSREQGPMSFAQALQFVSAPRRPQGVMGPMSDQEIRQAGLPVPKHGWAGEQSEAQMRAEIEEAMRVRKIAAQVQQRMAEGTGQAGRAERAGSFEIRTVGSGGVKRAFGPDGAEHAYVDSDEAYKSLGGGLLFVDPEGNVRRKPM